MRTLLEYQLSASTSQSSELANKKKKLTKIAIIVLAAVIVAAAGGGFFYWWNYMRATDTTDDDTTPTRLACRDNQWQTVEEAGPDLCQADQDCLPEPVLPASLIPIDQTSIIELTTDLNNVLLEKIKSEVISK